MPSTVERTTKLYILYIILYINGCGGEQNLEVDRFGDQGSW